MQESIITEIQQIKEKIDLTQKEINFDDGFKLLANLLKELRENKNLKLLTICRQIKNIQIDDKKVCLIAEDEVLEEIKSFADYSKYLKEFFNRHGLSLKINNDKDEMSIIDKLKDWLGDKLEIK